MQVDMNDDEVVWVDGKAATILCLTLDMAQHIEPAVVDSINEFKLELLETYETHIHENDNQELVPLTTTQIMRIAENATILGTLVQAMTPDLAPAFIGRITDAMTTIQKNVEAQ
jgi:hypothetical protein